MPTKIYANVIKCSVCQIPLAYTDNDIILNEGTTPITAHAPVDFNLYKATGGVFAENEFSHDTTICGGTLTSEVNTIAIPVL